MSESGEYTKVGPDTEYATQYTQLENIQTKFHDIEKEHTNNFNTLKAQVFVKKTPLFNELREVYKTIPHFWYTALIHTPFFTEIDEEEEAAELIKFISDIQVEYDSKFGPGGKIHIHFSENPFISNKIVSRELFSDEGAASSEIKVKRAQFDWKEGKEFNLSADEENLTNDFLGWLQCASPLETDYFFMQDFYPDAIDYYKGQARDYDDFSGSFNSQDDLEDGEGYSGDDYDEQDDDDDQPAFKKTKY